MKRTSFLIALVVADPAFAASGPFVSLKNTNFIVLLAFILFIGVLFYFNVPKLLGGMLDKRAETIRSELDEARKLREEAQSILASYERRQKEVQEQADRIVESARKEAEAEAAKARDALEVTVARRLAAAGYGVCTVPPDRYLRRGRADHRGRARRGRLPHKQRR